MKDREEGFACITVTITMIKLMDFYHATSHFDTTAIHTVYFTLNRQENDKSWPECNRKDCMI